MLVVEDEVRLAAYLARGLEAEAYAVDVATDGEQGLWMAANNTYDAIVLDIMLPVLNGYRVCAQLRQQGIWTPILMLTAKDGELDEAEALDTGADDFLTKPFSFVVLLARLRALTRRDPGERPTAIEVGPLRLDPASHRCHVEGKEVTLTPTEFCLLHQLLRHPGDVLSKMTLLGSCWDWAFDGDPNIVEVYVSHLRRKIDTPLGRTMIETVRGRGYRWKVDDV